MQKAGESQIAENEKGQEHREDIRRRAKRKNFMR